MGSVDEPGPDTKLAITKSSKDSVNASNQAATSAGAIVGMVIVKNTTRGLAPRSMAASSKVRSMPRKRDCTITATNAIPKVVCANMIVVTPRPDGQPKRLSSATNSNSSDKPVMTSGITSGAATIPVSQVRPRNQ